MSIEREHTVIDISVYCCCLAAPQRAFSSRIIYPLRVPPVADRISDSSVGIVRRYTHTHIHDPVTNDSLPLIPRRQQSSAAAISMTSRDIYTEGRDD